VLLGEELAEKKLGFAFTRINRHRVSQGSLRLPVFPELEQRPGDMEMQGSVLRPGFHGGAKACQGDVGPSFVEVQQAPHEVVVRNESGVSPRSWPHAAVGAGGLLVE